MAKKIIKNVKITTTGDRDNCGHCEKADKEIPKLVKQKKGIYEYVHISDPKAKIEIEKAQSILKQDIDSIPIIHIAKEVCEKKSCSVQEKIVIGYDRKEIKKELGL